MFRIFGNGEDGEKISGASFFHQEGESGGIEGSLRHQPIDSMGEVLSSDIIQMSSDFDGNEYRALTLFIIICELQRFYEHRFLGKYYVGSDKISDIQKWPLDLLGGGLLILIR